MGNANTCENSDANANTCDDSDTNTNTCEDSDSNANTCEDSDANANTYEDSDANANTYEDRDANNMGDPTHGLRNNLEDDIRDEENGGTHLLLAACKRASNNCILTYPLLQLRRMMLNDSVKGVTAIGNTGDGKTIAAKVIAWELFTRQEYVPMEVRSIQDIIDSYNEKIKILYLVDDPFGAYRMYSDFVRDWVMKMGELDKYFIAGNIKILVTMRTYIWEECKFDFKKSPPFNFVLNMSSSLLTDDDRRNILTQHLQCKHIDTAEWSWIWKIDRIGRTGSSIGFPLCCQMVTEQESLLRDPMHFLENPFDFIWEELRRMAATRPDMFSALALVMMNEGAFAFKDLDPMQEVEGCKLRYQLQDVLTVCQCSFTSMGHTLVRIRNTLESLRGTFLHSTREAYVFTHESISDAVALEFGKKSPQLLFKHARPQIIIKTVTTSSSFTDQDVGKVRISRELYPSLATSIIWELNSGHSELAFSNPSWWDPEFQEVWEQCLLSEKNDNISELFAGGHLQRSILHSASKKGLLRMLKFFNTYSNIDIRKLVGVNGETLLHSAASGGNSNVVDYLLKLGMDPNAQDTFGWTPLYTSSLCGRAAAVESLLLAGSDPNLCTFYGSSPIYVAALCGHWGVIPVLRSWGAIPITSEQSAVLVDSGLLSILFDKDNSHVAALLRAVRAGHVTDVMALLDCGIGVNETNTCGWTSLYLSSVCGREDIASLLLHRGAKPQQPTNYGVTPAYVAQLCGHFGIVQLIDSFETGLIAAQ